MKYAEVMIAWNPDTDQIRVGPGTDVSGWSDGYQCTVGACFSDTHKMTHEQLSWQVFMEFNAIVVAGEIEPKVAHRAFLVIDEYRQHCAPDLPGVPEAKRTFDNEH